MCWRGAAAPPRTEIEPGAGERLAPGLLRQVLLDAGRRVPDGGAPSLNLSQGQAPPRGPGSAGAQAPLAPRPRPVRAGPLVARGRHGNSGPGWQDLKQA